MTRSWFAMAVAATAVGCAAAGERRGQERDANAAAEDTAAVDQRRRMTTDAAETSADGSGGADRRSPPTAEDAAHDAGSTPSASTGCGKKAVAGTHNLSVTVGSMKRTFLLVVPSGYVAEEPQPLLFAYPGAGGNAAGARNLFKGVEARLQGKGLFAYVDPIPDPAASTSDGPEVRAFDAMLALVGGQYCVDRRRVFATGFSRGAGTALAIGCGRPDVLRGAALAAGNLFHKGITARDETHAMTTCGKPFDLWSTRGAKDAQETQGLRTVEYVRKLNGCAAETEPTVPAPCRQYKNCQSGRIVVWCPHPGGHQVPSFMAEGLAHFMSTLR